ncbi:exodeoxyribonuclease VII large subunit (plasmid) [Haloferax sp. S1W]|uniref:exodeoxyribonuclease VII large subunit n=1 Tax=Haloferax sp. S1W TaxID=3377110 RepID=UPI0037C97AC1
MGRTSEADADVVEPSRDILSVQQLNQRISDVVDTSEPLQDVRCYGEVTNLGGSSAALYFTLTDGTHELPCMLWRSRYRNMDIELEDGLEVIVHGDIDYWVEGGKLDIKPWRITVVGEGEQAAALERLTSELEQRGWFDDEHKKDPPRFPDRVGVVTSLQGDARYDIQDSVHSRNSTIDLVIKDASVQGPNAPTSLANGIHYLDRNQDVDSIIVGRGGGSDTDLMAFNHEAVAEAIFTSNTPVVAAVGHAEDRTIAGRVADRNAITPTDAGEYVTADVEQFLSGEVDGLEQELEAAYESFRREFEHERELEQAAAEAGGPTGMSPAYYKAIIAVLIVLLLVVLGLWLFT